jgi:hypothetical protein
MDEFRSAGYQELNGTVANINGISIFGDSDPFAFTDVIAPEDEDEILEKSAKGLKVEWDYLPEKPDVMLVHNKAQAVEVIKEAKDKDEQLIVVYGHDHKTACEQKGSVTLVDVGTSGASGFGDTGFDPNSPYNFQILEFHISATDRHVLVKSIDFYGIGEDKIVDTKERLISN